MVRIYVGLRSNGGSLLPNFTVFDEAILGFRVFLGAAGVIVGHPFDTVKVRLQTQSNGKYRGITHCFLSIIRQESPSGLYKGITSPLTGLAFINAICFGVYGNTLKKLNDPHSLRNHFLAGNCTTVTSQIKAVSH